MQLEILNIKGEKTGKTDELHEDIFGIEPNHHVIYLAVKQYLAAQRQGTHKVKTRSEVHGSSRKLHKQKGTVGSRKGNIRNPLYKGGGTIFGPKPHGYDFKLNRKVKDMAKISALSYKAKDNAILVIEDVTIDTPKTKQVVKALQIANKKAIIVTPDYDDNWFLSTRNIPNIATTLLADINTYEIMNADVLVLTEQPAKIFADHEVAEA
jgi:large subunit ribosomal protein L4